MILAIWNHRAWFKPCPILSYSDVQVPRLQQHIKNRYKNIDSRNPIIYQLASYPCPLFHGSSVIQKICLHWPDQVPRSSPLRSMPFINSLFFNKQTMAFYLGITRALILCRDWLLRYVQLQFPWQIGMNFFKVKH